MEKTISNEEVTADTKETEVLEGEVLGYSVESIMESIVKDLDASVEAMKMSDRNSRIIKAVMTNWFEQQKAWGIDYIDIRDE